VDAGPAAGGVGLGGPARRAGRGLVGGGAALGDPLSRRIRCSRGGPASCPRLLLLASLLTLALNVTEPLLVGAYGRAGFDAVGPLLLIGWAEVAPGLLQAISGIRADPAVLEQRKLLATRIEELLEAHPLSKVLTSMPGIGVRTGARILIDVGDGSSFPSAAHLAAYAGLAPATRSSGSSIRGEQPSRRGNKQLKRAFFLSAFAVLADPVSRAYYDKKIAQGKHHTQALLCLARRRADVLFAMLRDGTFHEPQPTPTG
jgi:hypothetical protein